MIDSPYSTMFLKLLPSDLDSISYTPGDLSIIYTNS